jgi:hypothetical protein
MKNIALITAAILLVASGAFLWQRSRGGAPGGEFGVLEIQRSEDGAKEGGAQDVVHFTDGDKVSDLGFDLEHVGTLELVDAKPVFLFKSFSCRQCEPIISLVIYSPHSREVNKFPYPGNHVLIGSEGEVTEVEDQVVDGVFGRCDGQEPIILVARKHREVESDGTGFRIGQEWNFSATQIRFTPTGQFNITTSNEDTFARLQGLNSDECQNIPSEDSHNYL